MSTARENPFDSIEDSQEYVSVLSDVIAENRREIAAQIAEAERQGAHRRKEALLLVSYNLAKLQMHMTTSRRILNDLRMLKRILLEEKNLLQGVPK